MFCARFLHRINRECGKDMKSMLKTNKNNTHEAAVCITTNGAAARCALGLLVVVVLVLSTH